MNELDGTEHVGFVIANVDAPFGNGIVIIDPDDLCVFDDLDEARDACTRAREESDNSMIFVYALTPVEKAGN